jgi:hypothetical protein
LEQSSAGRNLAKLALVVHRSQRQEVVRHTVLAAVLRVVVEVRHIDPEVVHHTALEVEAHRIVLAVEARHIGHEEVVRHTGLVVVRHTDPAEAALHIDPVEAAHHIGLAEALRGGPEVEEHRTGPEVEEGHIVLEVEAHRTVLEAEVHHTVLEVVGRSLAGVDNHLEEEDIVGSALGAVVDSNLAEVVDLVGAL